MVHLYKHLLEQVLNRQTGPTVCKEIGRGKHTLHTSLAGWYGSKKSPQRRDRGVQKAKLRGGAFMLIMNEGVQRTTKNPPKKSILFFSLWSVSFCENPPKKPMIAVEAALHSGV